MELAATLPTGELKLQPYLKGIGFVLFIIYEITHSGTDNAQRACAFSQYLRIRKLIIEFLHYATSPFTRYFPSERDCLWGEPVPEKVRPYLPPFLCYAKEG